MAISVCRDASQPPPLFGRIAGRCVVQRFPNPTKSHSVARKGSHQVQRKVGVAIFKNRIFESSGIIDTRSRDLE